MKTVWRVVLVVALVTESNEWQCKGCANQLIQLILHTNPNLCPHMKEMGLQNAQPIIPVEQPTLTQPKGTSPFDLKYNDLGKFENG